MHDAIDSGFAVDETAARLIDRNCRILYSVGMEVHLPENQEAQLNELATKTGRGTDQLVQEAVAQLLTRNKRYRQQAQVGIDQIARGEFIEQEEMHARVERMLES